MKYAAKGSLISMNEGVEFEIYPGSSDFKLLGGTFHYQLPFNSSPTGGGKHIPISIWRFTPINVEPVVGTTFPVPHDPGDDLADTIIRETNTAFIPQPSTKELLFEGNYEPGQTGAFGKGWKATKKQVIVVQMAKPFDRNTLFQAQFNFKE